MSEQMKAVVFEGVTYRVPVWVNWMARDQDSEINGYEYEPDKMEEFFLPSSGRWFRVITPAHDESWRNSAARV